MYCVAASWSAHPLEVSCFLAAITLLSIGWALSRYMCSPTVLAWSSWAVCTQWCRAGLSLSSVQLLPCWSFHDLSLHSILWLVLSVPPCIWPISKHPCHWRGHCYFSWWALWLSHLACLCCQGHGWIAVAKAMDELLFQLSVTLFVTALGCCYPQSTHPCLMAFSLSSLHSFLNCSDFIVSLNVGWNFSTNVLHSPSKVSHAHFSSCVKLSINWRPLLPSQFLIIVIFSPSCMHCRMV